jgi:hypothetical protein
MKQLNHKEEHLMSKSEGYMRNVRKEGRRGGAANKLLNLV